MEASQPARKSLVLWRWANPHCQVEYRLARYEIPPRSILTIYSSGHPGIGHQLKKVRGKFIKKKERHKLTKLALLPFGLCSQAFSQNK